jgi:UDP-glucose 4-epimerase
MIVTCLRFATACGMSDRLRLDLVLNDYVACALSVGEITVLSDGTPWRPLIDVADMARAMDWAIDRKTENGGRYLAVNAGSNRSNYQVKDLAEAVAAAIPGTRISINYSAPVDSRSYQADFSLYERLAPAHQPLLDLDQSVQNLISGLQRMNFNNKDFRESNLIRLVVLQDHINSERLSRDLEWRAFSR